VPELGKGRSGERDLGDRGQALINEPLEPAQGSAFVTLRIGCGEELTEGEGVG
jgi:hypothetical protein